jgi:hypothetical protein
MGADHDPAVLLEDVLLIRHALKPGDTFPAVPRRFWLVLIADGQRRSRPGGT